LREIAMGTSVVNVFIAKATSPSSPFFRIDFNSSRTVAFIESFEVANRFTLLD
jgi:hypothetical protein